MAAETWLRGEPASLVDDVPPDIGGFERIRQYLWLSEALSDPTVAERFEAALPPTIRQVCLDRVAELQEGKGR